MNVHCMCTFCSTDYCTKCVKSHCLFKTSSFCAKKTPAFANQNAAWIAYKLECAALQYALVHKVHSHTFFCSANKF